MMHNPKKKKMHLDKVFRKCYNVLQTILWSPFSLFCFVGCTQLIATNSLCGHLEDVSLGIFYLRGGTPGFSTYSWAIGIDVNNWNHHKCMRLDSQKKTEGFSKFLQCYDLYTGVLSEINSFRAPFLAKKIHKKRVILLLHTLIILCKQCCTRMSAVWRCLSGDKHPYSILLAGPSQLPGMYYSTNIIHELSHWQLSHWQWLFYCSGSGHNLRWSQMNSLVYSASDKYLRWSQTNSLRLSTCR